MAVVEDVGFPGSAVMLAASGTGGGKWEPMTTTIGKSVESTRKGTSWTDDMLNMSPSLAVERKTDEGAKKTSSPLAILTGILAGARAEEAAGASSTEGKVWTDDILSVSPSLTAEKKGDEEAEQKPSIPASIAVGARAEERTVVSSTEGRVWTDDMSDMSLPFSAAESEAEDQEAKQMPLSPVRLNGTASVASAEGEGTEEESSAKKVVWTDDTLIMSLPFSAEKPEAEPEKNTASPSARSTGIAAGIGRGNRGKKEEEEKTKEPWPGRRTPKPETGTSPVSTATKTPAMAATMVEMMPQSGVK